MSVWKLLLVVLMAHAFGVGNAYAEQGCPSGMIINPIGAGGQPECIPGANHQNWGSNTPGQPSAVWAKRWGAIAYDGDAGKFGAAGAMESKRKAEKDAIAHCMSKGAANCKIVLAYHNQCGALAFADGNLTVAHAPSEEAAEASALEGCNAKVGGARCKIYHSDCSFAERVR